MSNQIKFDDNFYNIKHFLFNRTHIHTTVCDIECAEKLGLFYNTTNINEMYFDEDHLLQLYNKHNLKVKLDAYQILSSGTVRKDSYCNPIIYQEVLGNEIFGKIQEVLNAN